MPSPTPFHVQYVIWELHRAGASVPVIVEQLERHEVRERTVRRVIEKCRLAEEMGIPIETALEAGTSTGRPPIFDADTTGALLAAVHANPSATLADHAQAFGVSAETISRVLEAHGVVVKRSRTPRGGSHRGGSSTSSPQPRSRSPQPQPHAESSRQSFGKGPR